MLTGKCLPLSFVPSEARVDFCKICVSISRFEVEVERVILQVL